MLPEPYELSATDPDEVSCWFGDWLLVCEGDKDLIVRNPERCQYKECGLFVRCRVNGVEGARCAYMWSDTDFALCAGMSMGFPKKIGRVYLSHSKSNLYGLNDALPKIGAGTRFGAFLEAHGDRLITGTIKLSRRISPDELPPPFSKAQLFNMVYVPSADVNSRKPLARQIVSLAIRGKVNYGELWAAEDASLEFSESELDEHTRIKPIEITRAYYMERGTAVIGTRLEHKW